MYVELAGAYRDNPLGIEAKTLLSSCVQCGQCTFICPTFRLLDDEWDGPRGRIFLIKQFLEGRPPDPGELLPAYTLATLEGRSLEANLQLHLDRCLTCRSCEANCPQGVQYGRLLDIGRELVERVVSRPFKERLWRRALRAVLPYRNRITPLLRLGQAMRPGLRRGLRGRFPASSPSRPWPQRAHMRTMLIWQGCVQPGLAPNINAAAARVLDRFGVTLIPASDGCCGALSQHMSAMGEAKDHMRRNIDTMWPHIENGAEAIVLTASGCGAHFQDYGVLLKDDPLYGEKARRVSELARDIAEVVADEWENSSLPPALPVPDKPCRIAFQSSCSLQHSQRLNGVVEGLLRRAGFKLVPVAYGFMCCGSAGSYSILQQKISEGLRALKLKTLLASKPQAIATANIGCMTHLAATSSVPVNHWIELLDEKLDMA